MAMEFAIHKPFTREHKGCVEIDVGLSSVWWISPHKDYQLLKE